MVFEKEYEDVLKNIETIIIGFYKQNPELIDSEVDASLDWLIKYYRAVSQGRSGGYSTLKGISAELAENVKAICEVLLGQCSLKESEKLTDIETKLIRFLIDGLTYNQIASNMNITIHGVRYHIMNIYKKLEVNTRHQIVSIFKG